MAAVAARLATSSDIDNVVALMRSIGVHFAGSKTDAVLRAVATDALRRPSFVTLYVVEQDRRLGGLVVAFTRRGEYWKRFPFWHPAEAARMAAHRLVRRLMRRFMRTGAPPPKHDELHDHAADALWNDDSEDISKVMYVGVAPEFRGAGLGRDLYRKFFDHLAASGYRYCDAQVSTGNTAAIALHRSFPFEFYAVPGGYFARLTLAPTVS